MHKFGIENNYISMAMNSMLSKTNNTVKSMNISETNAMVIDLSWGCIQPLLYIGGWAAFITATGGWGLILAFLLLEGSWAAILYACNWTHYLTNPGIS